MELLLRQSINATNYTKNTRKNHIHWNILKQNPGWGSGGRKGGWGLGWVGKQWQLGSAGERERGTVATRNPFREPSPVLDLHMIGPRSF